MNRNIATALLGVTIGLIQLVHAAWWTSDDDIRLNVTVSSKGNLRSDGKGEYRTGEDFVAAWLNPTRWPDIAFNLCMNWPFDRYPGIGNAQPPFGVHENRTVAHYMTDPVAPQGRSLGGFTAPGGGNDIALPKPLTAGVATLTSMAIGTSLSPSSAEVRFCNADCTEVFSLLFGEKSVFGYSGLNGADTTTPTVSRISEAGWRIAFTPRRIGRLWNRTSREAPADLGLYYYEGTLDLRKQ